MSSEGWLTAPGIYAIMPPSLPIDLQRKLRRHPNDKEVVLMDSYLASRTVALPPRSR